MQNETTYPETAEDAIKAYQDVQLTLRCIDRGIFRYGGTSGDGTKIAAETGGSDECRHLIVFPSETQTLETLNFRFVQFFVPNGEELCATRGAYHVACDDYYDF